MIAAPIRILLVDDSEVVRVGIASVLAQDDALKVIGQAGTSEGAVTEAMRLCPDVILMDVRIPEEGGIEACRHIREVDPAARILFLSAFADNDVVRASIVAGGRGYLLKEIDSDTLIRSIKRVAAGESILDPAITGGVLDWLLQNVAPTREGAKDELTPQEERIVELVADGLTNKEIAATLELSPKTVKNYLHNIFEKLGIQRRSQAASARSTRLRRLPEE